MNKKLLIVICVLLLFTVTVKAHPGGTDSNGCHHCRGETCDKYGMPRNYYHTHVNGESVPCPFPDPEQTYYEEDENDYVDFYEENTNSNYYENNSSKEPVKQENSKPTYKPETNNEEENEDNLDLEIFLINSPFIIIVIYVIIAYRKELKSKELNEIKKDYERNKSNYLNKRNPYTKTYIHSEEDYIKYKLEYNRRHKIK